MEPILTAIIKHILKPGAIIIRPGSVTLGIKLSYKICVPCYCYISFQWCSVQQAAQ